MHDDRKLAQKQPLIPIEKIAAQIGIGEDELEYYGRYKAKISRKDTYDSRGKRGKLVMVTAMTPTPSGEGKTLTSIGLSDTLNSLGQKTIAALREPSLGPVFGLKGGATGGGHAQVVPSDEINLHFTGDLHAVTSAHNLLAAMVDNRLHFDGPSGLLDCRRATWNRVLDVDDRVLREIVVGIGGPLRGIARETGMDITAASEVMAILCLSKNIQDLKERLGKITIGYSPKREPVFARQIKAQGSMAALLKEAVKPNIVQTLEGNPAFVHGGPFANIAHGTNTVIATRMALQLSDYVVTETGFGSDLGAEKFFNIVVRTGHIPPPDAVVLVATVRALKHHAGVKRNELQSESLDAIEEGFDNLKKHIQNMKGFGVPLVVAVNRFSSDTDAEIEQVKKLCQQENTRVAESRLWAEGSQGGKELGEQVMEAAEKDKHDFKYTYESDLSLIEKIEKVATKIYGAKSVAMEGKIRRKIQRIEERGFKDLPICVAKTPASLSDDKELLGRPEDFTLIVTDVSASSGAGFVVVYCGDIMTMPGLPKTPAAERIDITEDGEITGLK
ncbi:MAG: formate--tetrahydrofolate ligase [Candidatus Aminicenantes bacterium]